MFRHAKAEQGDDIADSDRRLTSRGRKAARQMGELAKDHGLLPELVLSSSSARTRETIELFGEASGHAGAVLYLDELYLAEPRAYIRALSVHAAGVSSAMVVGHNPGLEALVLGLTGERLSLPTAALVECVLPIDDFASIAGIAGELGRVFRPKDE